VFFRPDADRLLLLGLGLFLSQLVARIIGPAALEALLIGAVLVLIAVNVTVPATGAALNLIHKVFTPFQSTN
jgi:hypothetical protein